MSEKNDKYFYIVGVRQFPLGHTEEGKRVIDSFYEFDSEIKRELCAESILDDCMDEELRLKQGGTNITSEVNSAINYMKLRSRFNSDMIVCLFKTGFKMTKDEIRHFIENAPSEKLREAMI